MDARDPDLSSHTRIASEASPHVEAAQRISSTAFSSKHVPKPGPLALAHQLVNLCSALVPTVRSTILQSSTSHLQGHPLARLPLLRLP
eukprot:6172862-Pleurochrysis_carterae.AAC.4